MKKILVVIQPIKIGTRRQTNIVNIVDCCVIIAFIVCIKAPCRILISIEYYMKPCSC